MVFFQDKCDFISIKMRYTTHNVHCMTNKKNTHTHIHNLDLSPLCFVKSFYTTYVLMQQVSKVLA